MHERIIGAALPTVAALAYIGDARHSLYVRKMLVMRGVCKSGELNELSLGYVTAEAQARAYERIEHLLTEDEREVFRRAYNSSHLNKPRRASGKDYRTATGFEAVIGMLSWIGDEARVEELLNIAAADEGEKNDTED
ncbi:MAG: Mini-ribonuclease 3 [Clostridia bacterium]|nr:Mini-ribonuclease 3 [Clostridia bacterium]